VRCSSVVTVGASANGLAIDATLSCVVPVGLSHDAYSMFELPANRIVMSQTGEKQEPTVPAIIAALRLHVDPPLVEMNSGTFAEPPGSGVKAEIAICSGLAGFTAMFGSASRLTSALRLFGTTSTSLTVCARAGGCTASTPNAAAASKTNGRFMKATLAT
jgi:hypothetical protein